MNNLSYNVSKKKVKEIGLRLNNNLDQDIKNTLKILGNI